MWLTCEAAKQAKSALSAGQIVSPQPKQANSISVHQFCGLGVEGILKNSLMRQSLDNVTVVMVAFANFKRVVCGHSQIRSGEKMNGPENYSSTKPKSENRLKESSPALAKQLTSEQTATVSSDTKKIPAARS